MCNPNNYNSFNLLLSFCALSLTCGQQLCVNDEMFEIYSPRFPSINGCYKNNGIDFNSESVFYSSDGENHISMSNLSESYYLFFKDINGIETTCISHILDYENPHHPVYISQHGWKSCKKYKRKKTKYIEHDDILITCGCENESYSDDLYNTYEVVYLDELDILNNLDTVDEVDEPTIFYTYGIYQLAFVYIVSIFVLIYMCRKIFP